MSWQFARFASAVPQPWRNRGGFTRELLAWPVPGDWKVRVSVADVQAAGPFSLFDGVERWFAVLEGAGVGLQIEGETYTVTRESPPLRFDGGIPVECTLLDGPTRDFNLMTTAGEATLMRVLGRLASRTVGSSLVGVYAHLATARVELDGDVLDVPARTFAWRLQEQPAEAIVSGRDALWMEVRT